MTSAPIYRRVLLKISGEALMGSGSYGLDLPTVDRIAGEIKAALTIGTEVCAVIGGGNIFRGLQAAASGMERASADYMGMLATVMNALAMQNALERAGVPTRVQSAIPMTTVCEPYIRRRAIRHMEKGRASANSHQSVILGRFARAMCGSSAPQIAISSRKSRQESSGKTFSIDWR